MKLKILSNVVGSFNLSQKTFEFRMAIWDNKKVVEVDKVKAIIKYSGEPDDSYYFEDPIDKLKEVF